MVDTFFRKLSITRFSSIKPAVTYAKALKHLEGREAEFDMIFPGHYVHPIPKTYLKELIVCAEKIVENPLYGTPEKNHMSDQIAYRAFYKKASILYTMDRVTGEKAPQE